ncbi:hemin uptake protein HemP [Primorskyibacter sp. S187A]|uniref:hemin uptake protein HemP n=1 Tax=Primorskyibacter sp. S187A TaxID=3415130 RepID=UPI003C7BE4C7
MNAMTQVPDPTFDKPTPQLDTYDARDIVKDGVQACIVLDGQTYYLRITRAGKLILTK